MQNKHRNFFHFKVDQLPGRGGGGPLVQKTNFSHFLILKAPLIPNWCSSFSIVIYTYWVGVGAALSPFANRIKHLQRWSKIWFCSFLAVQNSSIGDLVHCSDQTNNQSLHNTTWPDLTKKIPTYLHTYASPLQNTLKETCDFWDTDYNSDNWEPEFMIIFVTWQLREGVQTKQTFLNGHCMFRGGGGQPLPGWFGPFFSTARCSSGSSVLRYIQANPSFRR